MPVDRVRVTIADHVAEVRLDRPDKRNGMDMAMFEALVAAGERILADRSVRAVVLCGEGRAFCAGLDWASFLSSGFAEVEALLARDPEKSPANLAQRVCWIWQEVPVPVIAAVQGAAYGAGFQLALAADIRYGARDLQMSAMEVRYGLIPDQSISVTLPRLVRADVARELVLTARVVEADEAASLGLVTRLSDDPLADARATARTIASRSPDAIRAAKRLFQQPHLDAAASLRLETELQRPLLGTKNQLEAVQAVMTKREPTFD